MIEMAECVKFDACVYGARSVAHAPIGSKWKCATKLRSTARIILGSIYSRIKSRLLQSNRGLSLSFVRRRISTRSILGRSFSGGKTFMRFCGEVSRSLFLLVNRKQLKSKCIYMSSRTAYYVWIRIRIVAIFDVDCSIILRIQYFNHCKMNVWQNNVAWEYRIVPHSLIHSFTHTVHYSCDIRAASSNCDLRHFSLMTWSTLIKLRCDEVIQRRLRSTFCVRNALDYIQLGGSGTGANI